MEKFANRTECHLLLDTSGSRFACSWQEPVEPARLKRLPHISFLFGDSIQGSVEAFVRLLVIKRTLFHNAVDRTEKSKAPLETCRGVDNTAQIHSQFPFSTGDSAMVFVLC